MILGIFLLQPLRLSAYFLIKPSMPAVPAPALVLVTGASGFVGSHVARELLEKGYSVVGTGDVHLLLTK